MIAWWWLIAIPAAFVFGLVVGSVLRVSGDLAEAEEERR